MSVGGLFTKEEAEALDWTIKQEVKHRNIHSIHICVLMTKICTIYPTMLWTHENDKKVCTYCTDLDA